jgi:hypothetical protein
LFGEFPGIGPPQSFEVLKFPSETRHLLQMGHAEQRPFGFGSDQRQQEPPLIFRQPLADELWKLVLNMDPANRNAIDAEAIDAISALLSGTDDYLVCTAASVLGRIGIPAALRSVPALMKALREIRTGSKRELQLAVSVQKIQ